MQHYFHNDHQLSYSTQMHQIKTATGQLNPISVKVYRLFDAKLGKNL